MIPNEPHIKARKVVLLGDTQVGKTSLINRLINNSEPVGLQPTIGCHCFDFKVDLESISVPLQLWDTAGQEMYSSIVPVYTRNAQAALVLFALNDSSSFEHLSHWLDLLMDTIPPDTPIFIVGSKLDLAENRVVSYEQGNEFAKTAEAKYYEISNMSGVGVKELFDGVAQALISIQKTDTTQNVDVNNKTGEKRCC